MNAAMVIAVLRGKIREAKENGATANTGITLHSLETLVEAIASDVAKNPSLEVTSVVVEQAKLNQASDLAGYAARAQAQLELSKSVITTAQAAVKSVLLVNGGSAVALLAFIGHLATSGNRTDVVSKLALPLLIFALGVGAAAVTAACVALTQKSYVGGWKRTGLLFVTLSITVGITALACFFVGSAVAYPIFRNID
jgi:hypothetical protein